MAIRLREWISWKIKLDTDKNIQYYRDMQNITYEKFVQAVDQVLSVEIGCSLHDLADYPIREDWEVCQEDLAFVAPEDTEKREQVFKNHVSYSVQDIVAENAYDANPWAQGVDY